MLTSRHSLRHSDIDYCIQIHAAIIWPSGVALLTDAPLSTAKSNAIAKSRPALDCAPSKNALDLALSKCVINRVMRRARIAVNIAKLSELVRKP